MAKNEEVSSGKKALDHVPYVHEESFSFGFWLTYGCFFFVGAAGISMWSAVMLCLDFFQFKYPTERVGFVFPIVNMSALLVISLYMVIAGRQLPLECRTNVSFLLYAWFIFMMPFVNFVPFQEHLAYALSIIALIGATVTSSILQSTFYGLGGVFGPYFVQAIDGGKGFGAILLFLVRIYLKWHYRIPANIKKTTDIDKYSDSARISMAFFFANALVMVLFAWGLYNGMKHIEFAQPRLKEYFWVQHETPLRSPRVLSPHASANEQSPLISPQHQFKQEDTMAEESEQERQEHAASATILNVARTAARPLFSLFLSFFVCLTCFPGIICSIPSNALQLDDWFPVVLVGCYSFGDLIGKSLPVYKMIFTVQNLHLPWALQVAFIPLFVIDYVCLFHDLLTMFLVFLFGIITGYVSTSSIILAPSICSEYQKEVAGMVAMLCAIIGLCAGSYNGLALETILSLVLPSKH